MKNTSLNQTKDDCPDPFLALNPKTAIALLLVFGHTEISAITS